MFCDQGEPCLLAYPSHPRSPRPAVMGMFSRKLQRCHPCCLRHTSQCPRPFHCSVHPLFGHCHSPAAPSPLSDFFFRLRRSPCFKQIVGTESPFGTVTLFRPSTAFVLGNLPLLTCQGASLDGAGRNLAGWATRHDSRIIPRSLFRRLPHQAPTTISPRSPPAPSLLARALLAFVPHLCHAAERFCPFPAFAFSPAAAFPLAVPAVRH
jgi:hypothetical protein